MGESSPLISIAMPVRNCERTLEVTLRSILWQTYADWELLLIDDGSTDATLRIAREFRDSRIRVFSDSTSKGLPERLNQAIALSKGRLFARMDGDDIAYPLRLERQASLLREHRDVDLVGSSVLVFGTDGVSLGKRMCPATHDAICSNPASGFPMSHPTFIGRLDWFKHWQFDKRAGSVCDQDLLLRSFSFSRFANVVDILQGYREEAIHLNKILRYRQQMAGALMRYFRNRHPLIAALAILEQTLKGGIDCFAVCSGLNHRLLRHRAQPITSAEAETWQKVWESVNQLESKTKDCKAA